MYFLDTHTYIYIFRNEKRKIDRMEEKKLEIKLRKYRYI